RRSPLFPYTTLFRSRHLNRVRIDLGRETDGLLDRLLRLAGQAENEGAMDLDAELVAILGEAPRELDAHALLDVEQDLLVAGLVRSEEHTSELQSRGH